MKSIESYRTKILDVMNNNELCIFSIPILITIILPFFKTLIDNSWSNLKEPNNIWYIIAIFLLLIWYVLSWINYKKIKADRNYLDEEIILYREIVNKYEKLKETFDSQVNDVDRATSMTLMLDYIIVNVVPLLMKENISVEEFKKTIGNTFAIILKAYQTFYNKEGELITIALYYYCEETNEFLEIESAKPEVIGNIENPTKSKGRIWHRDDESHISYTARKNTEEECVFNNINIDLREPKNKKANDNKTYISSISIPLFDDIHPNAIGVFSITSNYENRFDKEDDNIFVGYSNRIFIDISFNVAKIIEYILKKHFSEHNKYYMLIKAILEDYQNSPTSNCLTEQHLQLLEKLHYIDKSENNDNIILS